MTLKLFSPILKNNMKRALTFLLIALVFAFATIAYPYGAWTVTMRVAIPFVAEQNRATASAGNFGLTNGSYSTWAEVDTADSDSGSFGNNFIFSWSSDTGPYQESGAAYAYVNGYDKDGNFQHDDDSDTN